MEKEILRTELKKFTDTLVNRYTGDSTIAELLGTNDCINDYVDNQLRERWAKTPDEQSVLPDISLMQAESIVLEKQSAIDVDCKIDHTEIGLLFMEGYYHAKRKLEGNEP